MKKVMFDMDGVLTDFVKGFSMLAWTMFGTPIVDTKHKRTWREWDGLTKEQVDAVWTAIRKDDSFFCKLPSLVSKETMAKIEKLQDDGIAELYFVTARSVKNAKEQTEDWLQEQGIYNPTVIVSPKKGEVCHVLGIHTSIEDKSENADCVAWLTDGKTKSFILDQPYNSGAYAPHSSKVLRLHSVDQYIGYVRDGNIPSVITLDHLKRVKEFMFYGPPLI